MKLTANVLFRFLSDVLRKGSSVTTPAALMLMWIAPKSDSMREIVWLTWSREVMSVR